MNPISYLIENISWYAPIYNISWVLFMVFAIVLPLLFLGIFHLPGFRSVQPTLPWKMHFKTIGYLFLAAFVIFCFRLIPYWIFDDKILHFLGGGISIALIYEYFVINFKLKEGTGVISLKHLLSNKLNLFIGNFIILLLFACFFSVMSEFYEFASKALAGVEFDSSGIDTWMDILYNLMGVFVGYVLIFVYKLFRRID